MRIGGLAAKTIWASTSEGTVARLSNLRPTLGVLAPRMGYAPDDERARYRQRDVIKPWRRWYKTARWMRLRMSILLRDSYTCQMCGRVEADTSRLVCDHRTRHEGDERLFWDERNLWTLCAPCHNSAKQAIERGRGVSKTLQP